MATTPDTNIWSGVKMDPPPLRNILCFSEKSGEDGVLPPAEYLQFSQKKGREKEKYSWRESSVRRVISRKNTR